MDNAALFSLRLSLQVAAIATAMVFFLGLPVAYFLASRQFRGKEMIDMLFTLPLVLPPTVTGYYLVGLFGRNGLIGSIVDRLTGWSIMFTWQAAALAAFTVSAPLMIKTARASIESVDKSLIDASYTLGHSELQTALRVVLPLAKKGIIAGLVLSFARAMGEFGATLMLAGNIPGRTDTMPLAIYSLSASGDWTRANTMVLFLSLLSGLFLYAANRFGGRRI
jgi:molybdate transport system permease protein